MPLFLLMGGELVIAFLVARIAVWVLRGRRRLREILRDPSGPGGGGGLRAPAPARRAVRCTPPRRAYLTGASVRRRRVA